MAEKVVFSFLKEIAACMCGYRYPRFLLIVYIYLDVNVFFNSFINILGSFLMYFLIFCFVLLLFVIIMMMLDCAGSCCCARVSVVLEDRGYSSCGAWVFLCGSFSCGARGSRMASVFVVQVPSCPTACGIFPDQGLNWCLLHLLQGGFLTFGPLGKPMVKF